jgi:hypothetical protein
MLSPTNEIAASGGDPGEEILLEPVDRNNEIGNASDQGVDELREFLKNGPADLVQFVQKTAFVRSPEKSLIPPLIEFD